MKEQKSFWRRPWLIPVVALLLIILILVACGNTADAGREKRFDDLGSEKVSGKYMTVVSDSETGCEYLIVDNGRSPIPLNDAKGNPSKGCKEVLK